MDERRLSYVQVRFPGTIRKVFADATYQYVRKGDPLFTIYSPELVATQQEYLLARQNQKAVTNSTIDGVAAGASSLANAAEQRLRQWDVSDAEIAQLRESGRPISDLTIHSPVSGYITERNAFPSLNADPSTRLYAIADLSRVWVNAQVFQNDIGRVKPGDNVAITVDAYPQQTFSGHIEEILPQVDAATRTVRVRLAVNNPGVKLKPGMYVNADLKSALGRQLVVPTSAVFQTGARQIVFLDHGNGSLEPRDVTVGPSIGENIVILKGISAHQQIVTSANFLIDSESQLQAAGSVHASMPDAAPQSAATQAVVNADFSSNPNPPHKGPNTFRIKLSNADGSPVTAASVTVTFFMPAMPDMDMAAVTTTVNLADKGAGMYAAPGDLASGGTWQVTIVATKNGQALVTKKLRIHAEGGM
jgi:Cu(I)/Ag(I) efflux system membrane fusion protein/cobalt-zinc-cadmium efflux system membrane fusion protein